MGSGLADTKGAMMLPNSVKHDEHPKLKNLVVEASRSLARLDVDRLEELTLCCQALNRDTEHMNTDARIALTAEAEGATGEMAILAKVLNVTRANLNVMNRLRELRAGQFEYDKPQTRVWTRTENRHGNN
jgi:hypothetical protein